MRWLICRCSNLCQKPSPVQTTRKREEKYNCSTCRVVLHMHRTSHCKLKYHCAVCPLGMLYAHATVRIVLHWQKQSFKNWTTCANLSRPPRACALCSCLQLHDYLPFLFPGPWLSAEHKIYWLQRRPRASISLEAPCSDHVSHCASPAAKADVLTPFGTHHYIICILLKCLLSSSDLWQVRR